MTRLALPALLLAGACAATAAGQSKDALRTKLKDTAPRGDWVYDDLDAGFARATATGKPLLVVLRCVL